MGMRDVLLAYQLCCRITGVQYLSMCVPACDFCDFCCMYMYVSPDVLQTLPGKPLLPCDTVSTAASTAIVCC